MTDTETRPRTGTGADPVLDLFASASVGEHLLRGLIGLVLVAAGLALASWSAWALLMLPLGVVAWRGCPTCWLLGLGATRARACRIRS